MSSPGASMPSVEGAEERQICTPQEALALSVPRTARAITTAATVAADYRISLAGLDKLSAEYHVEKDKARPRE